MISLFEQDINPAVKLKSNKKNIVYKNRKKRGQQEPDLSFNRDVLKCEENSRFQYLAFELKPYSYEKIFNLSYDFYKELIKHPNFLKTCSEIGLDVENDLPSKDMFRSFVLKFVIQEDFKYNKTKANYFIQSIAWQAHKHIVHWSQTNLIKYMFSKWSIVWQNIIDSIHISTDRHCYWRVELLFDGDRLAYTNEQLDKLEKGEILVPTLYKTSNENYYENHHSNVAIEYLINLYMLRLLN